MCYLGTVGEVMVVEVQGQETVTICIGVGLLLFQEGVSVTW